MSARTVIRRYPLAAYFVLAYAVSGAALVVLGAPSLSQGGHRNFLSLGLFPVMVVWVGVVGLVLTRTADGKAGLWGLRSRMGRWRVGVWWYAAAVVIPPAAVLLVLTVLRLLVSPAFAPNFLALGIRAGLVAGFFEESGWTGFAYPRLRGRFGPVGGAVLLGVLSGIWHLPVVDSLGVTTPHGPAWPEFFVSFVALVAGLRVLICWIRVPRGARGPCVTGQISAMARITPTRSSHA